MKLSHLNSLLNRKSVVYIEDDIEEIVIRISDGDDDFQVYAKRHGKKERKTDVHIKVVYDALIQGKEITKERYDKY